MSGPTWIGHILGSNELRLRWLEVAGAEIFGWGGPKTLRWSSRDLASNRGRRRAVAGRADKGKKIVNGLFILLLDYTSYDLVLYIIMLGGFDNMAMYTCAKSHI